jgi:hypothetical protein
MLYVQTERGTYGPGDTFLAHLRLNNEGECINTVEASISYPPELLEASTVSTGESILTLWVEEPTIDQEQGRITLAGGIPAGYCGRVQGDPGLSNRVATFVFRVPASARELEAPQQAPITVADGSVLLNDGSGTQASLSAKAVNLTISASTTNSVNEWRTALQEDETPPNPFSVSVEQNSAVFDGNYYITFATTDKQSGLNYYQVKEVPKPAEGEEPDREAGTWTRAQSPYELEHQRLDKVVYVRAVDHAGNTRIASVTPESVTTLKRDVYSTLLLTLLVLGLAFVAYRVFRWQRHRPVQTTNTDGEHGTEEMNEQNEGKPHESNQ